MIKAGNASKHTGAIVRKTHAAAIWTNPGTRAFGFDYGAGSITHIDGMVKVAESIGQKYIYTDIQIEEDTDVISPRGRVNQVRAKIVASSQKPLPVED